MVGTPGRSDPQHLQGKRRPHHQHAAEVQGRPLTSSPDAPSAGRSHIAPSPSVPSPIRRRGFLLAQHPSVSPRTSPWPPARQTARVARRENTSPAKRPGGGRLSSQRPSKICVRCGLPFTWRKKWERDWEQVRFCSERCRRGGAA
ncbi:DUF2256 domain-containing protein [Deinococcus wulumuqiensis]